MKLQREIGIVGKPLSPSCRTAGYYIVAKPVILKLNDFLAKVNFLVPIEYIASEVRRIS